MVVINASVKVCNTTFEVKKKKKMSLYLIELGMEGATELHVLDQVRPLSLIGGDDADLVWFCSSLQ